MKDNTEENKMEKIISLCKRRGFIFPGSELYGGLAGTWDYGPFGVALKKNIENLWWKKFVDGREDMFGLESAILMNSKIWEASGHVAGFTDPLVECKNCKSRFRADQVLESLGKTGVAGATIEQMSAKFKSGQDIVCPSCGKRDWTDVRQYNMMFKTQIGAVEETSDTIYLRPENAQAMFVNYKNVMDSIHPKLPFGIAQIGRAFRNEITPRDFTFRTREFNLMEFEYFVRESDWEKYFDYWREEILEWMDLVGIDKELVHELEVLPEDRAHYSKRTIDFEFDFPFGRKELYGLAYRTNFDLTKHQEESGVTLEYLDEETREKFIPHAIEPSFGLDRTILALLVSAYREDVAPGATDIRTYLKFDPKVAPVICAVSPLLKNKPELVEKAREVFGILKTEFGRVMWDDNGNIGKRYRRQDEIGTPWCIVIDFDTLEDDTVTVRERDSGHQERLPASSLVSYIKDRLS